MWRASYRSWLSMAARQAQGWGTLLLARTPAQGLVEYGLILVMVMVVCVAIVTLMGQTVSGLWYQRIIDSWPN